MPKVTNSRTLAKTHTLQLAHCPMTASWLWHQMTTAINISEKHYTNSKYDELRSTMAYSSDDNWKCHIMYDSLSSLFISFCPFWLVQCKQFSKLCNMYVWNYYNLIKKLQNLLFTTSISNLYYRLTGSTFCKWHHLWYPTGQIKNIFTVQLLISNVNLMPCVNYAMNICTLTHSTHQPRIIASRTPSSVHLSPAR